MKNISSNYIKGFVELCEVNQVDPDFVIKQAGGKLGLIKDLITKTVPHGTTATGRYIKGVGQAAKSDVLSASSALKELMKSRVPEVADEATRLGQATWTLGVPSAVLYTLVKKLRETQPEPSRLQHLSEAFRIGER